MGTLSARLNKVPTDRKKNFVNLASLWKEIRFDSDAARLNIELDKDRSWLRAGGTACT